MTHLHLDKKVGIFDIADIVSCSAPISYLRYSRSYRDLEEMMTERGLFLEHTMIYRWAQRYAPEIDKRSRPFLKQTNDSWRVDETQFKVRGKMNMIRKGQAEGADKGNVLKWSPTTLGAGTGAFRQSTSSQVKK